MKDTEKGKFLFTIENVKPFIGVEFYFDDIKNVFDIEYNKNNGKLQSNVSSRIEVAKGISREKVINAIMEMMEKTWKRKRITFNAFIKDKDSFISNGNGGYLDINRKFDNKISFLDVVNFFGKDNVKLKSNIFSEGYDLISDTIVEELSETYRRRYKLGSEKNAFLASARKKEKKLGRIEARKNELSSSYIYMKYFEYIKTHFSFNGLPFLAQIPTLDKLRLNFFENEKPDEAKKEDADKSYIEATKRARLIYEPQTSSILVPIGRKLVSKEIKIEKLPERVSEPWWKNGQWLAPNEVYINLFLKYIFSYLKKIYSDKDQARKDSEKKWNKYETYKIKKVFPENFSNENTIRNEITKIRQVLTNPIFKQLLQFPYVEGRAYLEQYFKYLAYVIGRICYRTAIIKMEFMEENQNFVKRYFQYSYWSGRSRYDKIFERNFKYDFGDADLEEINQKLKNRNFDTKELEVLKHLSNEEYQFVEDELFQLVRKEYASENGGGILVLRDSTVFNGKMEDTGLVKLFRPADEPEIYKINIDAISSLDFKNQKTLMSILFKEANGIFGKKIAVKPKVDEIEPKDSFSINKMVEDELKENAGTEIMALEVLEKLTPGETKLYDLAKKLELHRKEKEKKEQTARQVTEIQREHFTKIRKDSLDTFEELLKKAGLPDNEGVKVPEEAEPSPQEMFEDVLYDAFSSAMAHKRVTREVTDEKGSKENCDFYAVNIYDYNIDMRRPRILSIIKSVLFKPIIDEMRPFVLGQRSTEGNVVKKTIKLNDWETIEKIISFKHEQLILLIDSKEKEYKKQLEIFNKSYYDKLALEYNKKAEALAETPEVAEIFKEKIRRALEDNYETFIKRKKKELEEEIENARNNLLPKTIAESRRLAEDYSINFIVKNINAQEKNTESRREGAAIFLEDVHNMVKKYKGFSCRAADGSTRIFERTSDENAITERQRQMIREYNESVPYEIDTDFLLADTLLKLSRKFTFSVPFIREYSPKITDQFVTMAFFDDIDNVEKFIDGAVFNASNLNILKSKYKLFRNHPEIKKEVTYKKGPKVEKAMLNYSEYLKLKYKEGAMLRKLNPFEITAENAPLYEGLKNCWKYHRILDENVKYLYTNIDVSGEVVIYSNLFSHYEEFAIQMLTMDRALRFAWRERGKHDVEFKNYRVHRRTFEVYVAGEYAGTVKLNIESSDETYTAENVYEKLKKILKKG